MTQRKTSARTCPRLKFAVRRFRPGLASHIAIIGAGPACCALLCPAYDVETQLCDPFAAPTCPHCEYFPAASANPTHTKEPT